MSGTTASSGQTLKRKAADDLQDATRVLFFDEDETVLCSSFEVSRVEEELAGLKAVYEQGREPALRAGVRIDAQRFEVHRYDPPLIYGRTMSGDPVQSEAFALCRTSRGPSGKPAYGLITFALPHLTARLVPMLLKFCEENLGP